jgi:hypothetical protein
MRKFLMFLALLALPSLAHATYVQSGKTNVGSFSTITCSPNSGTGSVVTGDIIVMAVWFNVASSPSISSVRVTSWTLDQNVDAGSVVLWHGVATSSGVETISVHNGTTNSTGAVCGEYSTTGLNVTTQGNSTNSVSVTTTVVNTDIVMAASCNGCTVGLGSPFITRAQSLSSGNPLLALGDVFEAAAGTYTATNTGVAPNWAADAFFGSNHPATGWPRHHQGVW